MFNPVIVCLAEQCVKLLEHICQREASAVYDAGGLAALLHLIKYRELGEPEESNKIQTLFLYF